MSEKLLRVGILSFAHGHAQSYAAALNSIEQARLVGVWDDDAERGRAAARQHGTRWYEQQEALLAEVDAVVVAAENARHRDLVLAAAQAGVHVLCEKPLATTVEDAQAMVAACAAAGVSLGTAFPVRYSDAVRQLRAAVQAGALGETLMIRGTNQGRYPGGWFGDPALAGGGALMDHIVHVADLVRWIWGSEFREVYAEAATRHYAIPVEDSGLALAALENGVVVSIDCSWSRPQQSYPTWGGLTLEVTGTQGAAHLDAFSQNIEFYSERLGKAEWLSWGDNLDLLLLQDWVRAMLDGRPAPISGEDGLRTVELVVAAYRSAASHERVSVGANLRI